MTRKDYQVIAANVKDSLDNTEHSEGRVSLWMFVANFCHTAKKDNPRFDSVKFQIACGFE